MTRIRVDNFSVSIDGYGAGPDQDLDNPLGVGGMELHQWMFPTQAFQQAHCRGGGTTGIDNDFAARGFAKVGAWIIGRNMFGPVRGSWGDMSWQGWWGNDPPFRAPVFVLTHHARPSIDLEGGTSFHFVTDGIHRALELARKSAGGLDVRVGGGPETVQQFLRAGLVDEIHIAIARVLLGRGERLFDNVDLKALGFECTESVTSEKATHIVLRRRQ
jgi:dihydrofolate reductase